MDSSTYPSEITLITIPRLIAKNYFKYFVDTFYETLAPFHELCNLCSGVVAIGTIELSE